nr:hypothetical protein Iba_chr14cCG5300 [Ipomoea batatas]
MVMAELLVRLKEEDPAKEAHEENEQIRQVKIPNVFAKFVLFVSPSKHAISKVELQQGKGELRPAAPDCLQLRLFSGDDRRTDDNIGNDDFSRPGKRVALWPLQRSPASLSLSLFPALLSSTTVAGDDGPAVLSFSLRCKQSDVVATRRCLEANNLGGSPLSARPVATASDGGGSSVSPCRALNPSTIAEHVGGAPSSVRHLRSSSEASLRSSFSRSTTAFGGIPVQRRQQQQLRRGGWVRRD